MSYKFTMFRYVQASTTIRDDYVQFKQHILAYISKVKQHRTPYDVIFVNDIYYMCDVYKNKMDDEIKTNILDVMCHGKIHDVLGDNHVPTDEQLNKLHAFQTFIWITWPYYTYAAVRYINRIYVKDIFEKFIESSIMKIRWDDQCLTFVCDQSVNINVIKQILNTSGLSLTSSTLSAAYRRYNIPLIDLHDIPITDECILAAAENPNNANVVLNLVNQLPLTSINTLSLMIQIKQCTLDTFNNILQHVSPTQEHVKLACTHHRIDLIQMLLNYRLSVDAECFELMFFTAIIPPPKYSIPDAIEQFISAGYQLTYEDVVRLARRKFHVHDINRFNFTFDDELINSCIMNNFYPYGEDLPYTIKSLQLACQISPLSISRIIDSGVIPDRQCVFNIFIKYINDDIDSYYVPYISLLLSKLNIPLDAELTHLLIKYDLLEKTSTSLKY